MANTKTISKRMYYALKVEFISPLCVSNGENMVADKDVLKNGSGEYFIPGTALAGALRNTLMLEKNEAGIMGFSDGEKGNMSSVFISDVCLSDVKTTVRDCNQLTENKTSANKFDMEIIEAGAKGIIYINYIVRENYIPEDDYNKAMANLFNKLDNGEIRLGASKNRGFGRLKIKSLYECVFDRTDVDKYITFSRDTKNIEKYNTVYNDWNEKFINKDILNADDYIKITVPLKLEGGISIRVYSTEPYQADYEHITNTLKPIIPGTSWNGAIRAQIRKLLDEMGLNKDARNKCIDMWFGSTNKQSIIVIGESEIEGATAFIMTRNKINRFDASTINGALYTEKSYAGGKTKLEIMVKKDKSCNYEALLEMLELVIFDLQNGYLSVGGLTSIGRGIFAAVENEKVEKSENYNCSGKLAMLISGNNMEVQNENR